MNRPPDPDPLPVRAVGWTLAAATTFVALRRLVEGDFRWLVWSDRDLARAHLPLADLPTSAAELSYGVGAGTPGGALYVAQWLVSWVDPGPRAAWLAQTGLATLGAAVLGVVVGRRLGVLAGAVCAAALLTSTPDAAAQQALWNPAWVTGFLALATAAWLFTVSERDARPLLAWGLCLAIAAQMHVTVALLLPLMLVGVLVARPARLGVGLVGATVGVLVAYAPWLIHEARHGATNLRQLAAPTQIEDLTAPVLTQARPWENLTGAVLTLASEPTLAQLGTMYGDVVVPLGLVSAALLTLGVLATVRTDDARPTRRIALAATVVVVGGILLLARSRHYTFRTTNASRYLLFLVPAAAVLSGAATRTLTRRGPTWARTAVALTLAGSLGVRLWALDVQTDVSLYHPLAWSRTEGWLNALRGAQAPDGTRLDRWADLAGRTTFVLNNDHGETFVREEAVPIAFLQQQEGSVFPGSSAPPCAAVVVHDSPLELPLDTLPDARLGEVLGVDQAPVQVLGRARLTEHAIVLWFRPDHDPCPTNLVQRYVWSPEEALTAEHGDSVPVDTAVSLPNEGSTRRWLMRFDAAGGEQPHVLVTALLTARRDGADVELTLHSNQLRGYAWNRGFYEIGRVRAPRVQVGAATGAIVQGVVGRDGLSTPLRATVSLPSGPASFTVDLQPAALRDHDVHDGPVSTLHVELPGGLP